MRRKAGRAWTDGRAQETSTGVHVHVKEQKKSRRAHEMSKRGNAQERNHMQMRRASRKEARHPWMEDSNITSNIQHVTNEAHHTCEAHVRTDVEPCRHVLSLPILYDGMTPFHDGDTDAA